MTEDRLEYLMKWSEPKSAPCKMWGSDFALAIYYCCITLDECKQLVEIVDTKRRTHIEEGCKRYFGEAWK